MKRLLLPLLCLAPLAAAQAPHLPPVPSLPAARTVTVGDLRTCTVEDLRLTVDRTGRVRFLTHGHRFPDNTLVVRQSYDRAGRLIRETGKRRAGVTTPLRSFLQPVPRNAKC